MIRDIVRDEKFLKIKSKPVTSEDLSIADDLRDTLTANRSRCVGMAANMIGYHKNMIIVAVGPVSMVMLNPRIISREGPYDTEEGCLSLAGVRRVTRYDKIEVQFENTDFEKFTREFTGEIDQIIQHECDHLEGKII